MRRSVSSIIKNAPAQGHGKFHWLIYIFVVFSDKPEGLQLFHCATVAAIRRGSKRHTVPALIFESHTDPRPTRIASPPSPANCCTTLPVAGSIREIGNSKEVTQTEPSPKAISPPEPGTPTSMVSTTLFVFGSTFETSPLV